MQRSYRSKKKKRYSVNSISKAIKREKTTIIRWEKEKLIPKAKRDEKGWRYYNEKDFQEMIIIASQVKLKKEMIRYGSKKSYLSKKEMEQKVENRITRLIIKEKEDKLEKKEPVLDQIIKSSLGRTNLHFGIQDKNRGNFLLNKILQQVIMDKSGKDLIRKIRQYRDLYILMVAILLKNNEHFRDSLASQLARRSYMYNN